MRDGDTYISTNEQRRIILT